MSDRLNKLNEQRQRAVKQMREIADRQVAGEMRADDEAAYVKANEDIDRLGKLMADERKLLAGEQEWSEALEEAESRGRERGARGGAGRERRDGSTLERSEWRRQFDSAVEAAGGVQPGLKGSVMQKMPDPRSLSNAEARAALVTNTATRGPEVIDETLVRNLFVALFDEATILSAGVTVLRTETANPLKFPKLVSRGKLSQANARRTETQQIQKSEPTLAQFELGSYKYAQISQASAEVVRDAVVDIENLLGTNLGINIAEYLAYDLLLGTGTGMPRGVHQIVTDNAATHVVTRTSTPAGSAAHVPTFDELLDVMWKLKPAYRRNGKWLLNDATVLPLRKIKDADDNYLWAPGDATTPDTLHNRPVLVEPNMPVFAEDAISMIYADFSKYYVRFVQDARIDWSTEYAWDTDMVSVRGIVHGDGDAVDDTAFAGFRSDLA